MTPRYQLCSKVSTPTAAAGVQIPTTDSKDQNFQMRFQASLVGGGTATVKIQGSDDNNTWFDIATFGLDSTTPAESALCEGPMLYARANVTAVATGSVWASMVLL